MKTWIFQGKPERYDVKTKLKQDDTETWLVSRFRQHMSHGDVVYFWRSGPREERGLYGWGIITSEAAQFYESWGWGIDIRYVVRFTSHIPASEVESSHILENNLILRMPIGTNFELTNEEASCLNKLILDRGQKPPPTH